MDQPVVTPHRPPGIAAQVVRDTHHDPRSQRLTGAEPMLPSSPVVSPDLSVVGIHGGPIPEHSESWRHYFSSQGGGTAPLYYQPIDVRKVHQMVSDPNSLVSGNTHDGWRTLFALTTGPMRNGSSNHSSYTR